MNTLLRQYRVGKQVSRYCIMFLLLIWSISQVYYGVPAQGMAQNVDEGIRRLIIKSLPEVDLIKNKDLKEWVYKAWALTLSKGGYKRIEDMPTSMEPGSAPLKKGTRADIVCSMVRIALAFTKDMEDNLADFEADMDKVRAATLCYSLDTPEFKLVMGVDKQALSGTTHGQIARRADMAFWTMANFGCLLEGAGELSLPVEAPFVMWEKERKQVDETTRKGVIKSLPEATMLKDQELRERLYDAWAFSLSKSSFNRIEDMRGSGSPDSPALKQGTQADHIRAVARLAVAIAEEFEEHFGLRFNRDEVIAGGLLHDVGKPFEFDPENRKRWQANPRITGYPTMRHSVYGAYIALAVGLPERIAHIPGAHSREGQFIERSMVCEIIGQADHAYWDITDRAGLLQK